MKYNKVKMEDALEALIDYRGKTPKKSDEGIETLSAKSVKNGYIDYSQCYYISKEEYNHFMVRGFPKKGDILLTTEAPMGMVARLDKDDVAVAQRLLTLRGKKEILDNDFLMYYLQSPKGQASLKARETGTTVTGIKQAEFRKIELELPAISYQIKVSSILRDIDDKIELNNKINENLQQQAQALFKSWFVDFELFGREQPDGWGDTPLGNCVEIKRGGSPRPIQEYLVEDGLHWLKISDVTSLNSPFILTIKEHIKEEGLRKTVFLKAGTLVLSNSATPGIPKILDVDSCIHDGWLYFPKSEFSKYYLYLLLQHIRKELVSLGNGSVFTNLKTDILRNFVITKPDTVTLSKFDEIVSPFFEMILNLDRETQRLSQVRDALLPKLMNGEIDLDGI